MTSAIQLRSESIDGDREQVAGARTKTPLSKYASPNGDCYAYRTEEDAGQSMSLSC